MLFVMCMGAWTVLLMFYAKYLLCVESHGRARCFIDSFQLFLAELTENEVSFRTPCTFVRCDGSVHAFSMFFWEFVWFADLVESVGPDYISWTFFFNFL